ncbi:hypothetical protein EON64_16930, partial [archaeon]
MMRLASRVHRLAGSRLYSGSASSLAKILATDGVDQCCVDIFKARGHHVDLLPTMAEGELLKIIGSYDGLVVRSATRVNSAVIQAAQKMRVVGR